MSNPLTRKMFTTQTAAMYFPYHLISLKLLQIVKDNQTYLHTHAQVHSKSSTFVDLNLHEGPATTCSTSGLDSTSVEISKTTVCWACSLLSPIKPQLEKSNVFLRDQISENRRLLIQELQILLLGVSIRNFVVGF